MEGRISGRDVSEVKEFILERIQAWMYKLDMLEEASDHVQLDHLYGHIENDIMLTKGEAKVLEFKLSQELEQKLAMWQVESRNPMLAVDVFSIYSDAWGLYCRPGTYSI